MKKVVIKTENLLNQMILQHKKNVVKLLLQKTHTKTIFVRKIMKDAYLFICNGCYGVTYALLVLCECEEVHSSNEEVEYFKVFVSKFMFMFVWGKKYSLTREFCLKSFKKMRII